MVSEGLSTLWFSHARRSESLEHKDPENQQHGALRRVWRMFSASLESKRRSCSHLAQRVVNHPWFDQGVVVLILTNCVILAFDDPTATVRTLTRVTELRPTFWLP